jgi:hypothetical protein
VLTVRVLRDGRPFVSAAQQDRFGLPVFKVGGGNTVKLAIDYTAFLGDATYSSGAWTIGGATQGTATQSGAIVTTLLVMPDRFVPNSEVNSYAIASNLGANAVHRLTASDGRIHNCPVQFWIQPASGTDLFILDGAYLA